jgi:hypothetical protein
MIAATSAHDFKLLVDAQGQRGTSVDIAALSGRSL